MSDPVTSIRNIGPAVASSLAGVGIHTAEDLRAIGAEAAYSALLKNGHRPHFIAFYALVMGLQGRPWNDCAGAEKAALRKRFDALKVTSKPASSKLTSSNDKGHALLDAALEEIGVIDRRSITRRIGQPTSSRPEKK